MIYSSLHIEPKRDENTRLRFAVFGYYKNPRLGTEKLRLSPWVRDLEKAEEIRKEIELS